jgi:3-carboxy-cis,cis-muconate cycloisomerase
MQNFGEDGPEINKRLGKKLELTPLPVPSRSANDFLAEYVSTMAIYATTCSKVAQELYTLMADEFGEVTEGMGKDVIGSSTMPQKVNSKVASNIITVAARIRSQMFLAFEGMHSSHEGDAATNKMMSEALDTVCTSVYEMTLDMKSLIGELQLNPEAMRLNLDKTKGLIVAENIMMTLAPVLGRQKAHDLLHHAAELAVAGDKNLSEILKSDPTVSASISQKKLDEALDPVNYLGHSIEITEDTIARVKKVLPKLSPNYS